MSLPRQLAELAPGLPLQVVAAYRNARELIDAQGVAQALDQFAVRLTLRYQDLNPTMVWILPDGAALGGMMSGRMVFAARQVYLRPGSDAQDIDALNLDPARPVIIGDGHLGSDASMQLAALLAERGHRAVCIGLLGAPQSDPEGCALPLDVAVSGTGWTLFGAGLSVAGYGGNLGGLYAAPVGNELKE